MDRDGDLLLGRLSDRSIVRVTPGGAASVVVRDVRLRWADAMAFDTDGRLLVPAAQLDGLAAFHGGSATIEWPLHIYSVAVTTRSGELP